MSPYTPRSHFGSSPEQMVVVEHHRGDGGLECLCDCFSFNLTALALLPCRLRNAKCPGWSMKPGQAKTTNAQGGRGALGFARSPNVFVCRLSLPGLDARSAGVVLAGVCGWPPPVANLHDQLCRKRNMDARDRRDPGHPCMDPSRACGSSGMIPMPTAPIVRLIG